MQRIIDLKISQVAQHALNVFFTKGRTVECARLIFHAFKLGYNEPKAYMVLSGYFDKEGYEAFSAAALEFAISDECKIPENDKKKFSEALFQQKWFLGFSQHVDGHKWLRTIDMVDHSEFLVDEERYQEMLILPLVKRAGSLKQAVDAALILVGVYGELIDHKEGVENLPMEEIYSPDRFIETAEYDKWLKTPTFHLEDLEAKRAR